MKKYSEAGLIYLFVRNFTKASVNLNLRINVSMKNIANNKQLVEKKCQYGTNCVFENYFF